MNLARLLKRIAEIALYVAFTLALFALAIWLAGAFDFNYR